VNSEVSKQNTENRKKIRILDLINTDKSAKELLAHRVTQINHSRDYVNVLLYCLRVERMFREAFAKVDVQYFYILAHLTPYPPLFARLESCFVRASAENCFAAGLICEKR